MLAAIAILAASVCIDRAVVVPWKCSTEKLLIKERTTDVVRSGDSIAAFELARDNVSRLRDCIQREPDDMEGLMLLAANLRFLDQRAEAAEIYRTALQYDRRPELLLELGTVELQLNQRAEAMRDLSAACMFNPNMIPEIPDSGLQQAVAAEVYGRQQRILQGAHKPR